MNLYPYYDVVRDANGNAVTGATVNIYRISDGSLATVYDKSGNSVTQPLATDQSGAIVNGATGEDGIGFWALAGRYRLEVSVGAEVAALPELQLGPQITKLDDSTDLDTIVQPGAYDVYSPVNSPDGASSTTWWSMEVVRHSLSTDNAIQVATRLSGGIDERHFRIRKAAVWGPWARLLDSADPAATRALIELDNVPNVDTTVAANVTIADSGDNFTATNVEDALAEEADARQAFEAIVGQANGLAPLDANAKVPTSYLPALSLTDVTVVASEAEQLALVAQEGDVAVRSDISSSYIHNGGTAGTMADWTELQTPPDAVLSVFGRTGAVSAQSGDYTAAQIPIADAGGVFTAAEVESALAELAAAGVAHQTDPDPHPQYATDTDLAAHTGDLANPHQVTSTQVGLGNVQNVDTTVAANVDIVDAGGNFTAANVEDALAEEADARQAHEAAADPHPQYATDGDLAAHSADVANPHQVTAAQVGLGNVQNVDTTVAANVDIVDAGGNFTATDVESALAEEADARQVFEATKGQANGLAPLDANAKVPTSYLPALSLTDVTVVASEAEQLALVAQEGDVAVRSDISTSYIHNGGTAGTMADWTELQTPPDAVLSVFGRTGAVTAQSGDYSAAQIPIADAGGVFTAGEVESALAELAAAGVAHQTDPDPHPQYATDTDLAAHTGDLANPHQVTSTQVGLGNVQNVDTTVAANVDIVDAGGNFTATNVEDALAEEADARQAFEATKGQANGLAPLGADAKIPTSYLPDLSSISVFTVASEAEQLALAASEGDVAVRTDINAVYMHNGGTSGTMSDWVMIQASLLNYFAESRDTTVGINDTVPVHAWAVLGNETDVDLAILPKGDGAIIAAVPDGSHFVGGNKRGFKAVDLQMARAYNTDVASGNRSVICGGEQNMASGAFSVVAGGISNYAKGLDAAVCGGAYNVASADTSFIGGGQNNTVSAPDSIVTGGKSNAASAQYAVVSGGFSNTASGEWSVVGGGEENVSSNWDSVVSGGWANTASAPSSTVGGGSHNEAIESQSTVGGGAYNIANGYYSTVPGGLRASTQNVWGKLAYASGAFGAGTYGNAQWGLHILRAETLDDTAKQLATSGGTATATNTAYLPDNSSISVVANVVARNVSTGDTKVWEIKGAAKRGTGASTVSLVGVPAKTVISEDVGASAWDCNLVANTTTGSTTVEVTGEASTTIRWVCKLDTVELG